MATSVDKPRIAQIPTDIEVDPVTLDIIEGALKSARYEMDAVLFRSAMSPVIREQHDEFPIIADPEGRIAQLFKTKPDDKRVIEELYLSAWCRMPTEKEIDLGVKRLAAHPDKKQETAQDTLWALINTSAFLFNR